MCDGTTNQIELSRTAIAATAIPVAPREEQTRIADQLDTLLARIKACNDHLDAIPGLLKRFRQAVLLSATSGELTADWREAASTDSWVGVKIGDLIDGKPRNGYSPKAVEYETQVRSLTLTATKYIDEEIPGDSHLWLEPGDILIQRANTLEYVGVSAVFDGPRKSFIYPDLMMKCRPNHRVDGRFLFYLLSAEPTRQYFREHATGTAGNMPKINQQTVMSAQGALPPLDEQIEIVQRTENLLGLAKRIAQLHAAAKSHAQRLAPLTLAKAFLGELVPQDPKDETANALKIRPPDCGSGSQTH
jgi:type I restriction enzyme S subunit